MIRIAIASPDMSFVKQAFETFFIEEHLEYQIVPYQQQSHQDIYIIEIQNQKDLQFISTLPHSSHCLYYVIGPEDYELASECIRLKVDLYFSKQTFLDELKKYKANILQDIQDKFQYYEYQRNGISSQIRLSHIYYVESLRHSIIIHSVSGRLIERKNLRDFLKHIHSPAFVQIHKSFIVNKQWIQKVSAHQIVLKNAEILQIGRAYKNNIEIL
ncbi:LytTR family transcriptional regulator [Allocoprobacillus halotolerans]|uniref:LytTR family transcriptional regulator n=1 Tax=Allocoprobacillus halotolerans TaxID=2944914 RepID=A0ABY5I6A3_9FIRM|nr:LytTR family DNA-binding domain-containing protein [Allocoprobacillus halotolerans]UTY40297.1 LytTR family transcriptional regulator [Allocoprobacillus halotolerans]